MEEEEIDYADPIQKESADQDMDARYGDEINPVGSAMDKKLAEREKIWEANAKEAEDRVSKQRAAEQDLIDNPDPYQDSTDYFALVTSGKVGDNLEDVNDLDVEVKLHDKEYYWDNAAVKAKFEEKYGSKAKEVFDLVYKEIAIKHYNLIAQNSLMGRSNLSTDIFAEAIEASGSGQTWNDVETTAFGSSILGQEENDQLVTIQEKWANRGVQAGDRFFADQESARGFNRDFYKDPETGEIKLLTPERIKELEDQDDFLAFKYDGNYLAQDDSDRSQRFITVVKKGEQVNTYDQLVSSWDLSEGWLSNSSRENSWGRTLAMAIPKFGVEIGVAGLEGANNLLTVGSALVGGDEFDDSEWGKWLMDNDAYLKSSRIASTDEAMENPYTSLDGLVDLTVNVSAQLALAYLTGGAVGGLSKAAGGFRIARVLGKGASAGRKLAAARKSASWALKSGNAGNTVGKVLMTSMAMGDIYKVGREAGLSAREAASVGALAYAGLWKVLSLSDHIWKPFETKVLSKKFSDIAKNRISKVAKTLNVTKEEAVKIGVKNELTGNALTKFVKKAADRKIVKLSSSIVKKFGKGLDAAAKAANKTGPVVKDAFNEGLEEVAELWTIEAAKGSYNWIWNWGEGEIGEKGNGRFEDLRDAGYATKKLDESIQSFIGGALGGGIMAGARAGFTRTEPELKGLIEVFNQGKVKEYTNAILDGYDNKNAEIYAAHEFTLTTKKGEDGRYIPITQELRNQGVKTIAEIKRDLLLHEINETQTQMELDGVHPDKLKDAVDAGTIPETVMDEYNEHLLTYLSAKNKQNEIPKMASTEGAIATTAEASEAQATQTQEALENVNPEYAKNEQVIQDSVNSMDDVVNGLTIINNIKKKLITKYKHLNKDNDLTKADDLFDKLNIAQAKEIESVNSFRKTRVENAKNLNTAITSGIDNYDAILELLSGNEVEKVGDEERAGLKYLYKKDKDAIIKLLEANKATPETVMADEAFMKKFNEILTKNIDKQLDVAKIAAGINEADKTGQISMFNPKAQMVANAIREHMIAGAVKRLKSSTDLSRSIKYLPMPNLVLGEGNRFGDILTPRFLNKLKSARTQEMVDALIKDNYPNFEDVMMENGDLVDGATVDTTEISTLYKESFPNLKIEDIVERIGLTNDADNQEGDKSIIEILNKYVNITKGEEYVDDETSVENLVTNEAIAYSDTETSEGSGVYTYKDAERAKRVHANVEAQLEAIQLTAELATLPALKEARLRSASIRKGAIMEIEGEDGGPTKSNRQKGGISATAYGLLTPYSIKDSYDNFEDFFTTMYFDPIRVDYLENREKYGLITTEEKQELDRIDQYMFTANVLPSIDAQLLKAAGNSYAADYTRAIMSGIKVLRENDAIELTDEQFDELESYSYKKDFEDSDPRIKNINIPVGKVNFTDKMLEILPAPIGQYFSLMAAKNDMKFFIEESNKNTNLVDLGLSLKDQYKLHKETLEVFKDEEFLAILSDYEKDDENKIFSTLIDGKLNGLETALGKDGNIDKKVVKDIFNIEKEFLLALNTISDPDVKEKILTTLSAKLLSRTPYENIITSENRYALFSEIALALEYNVDDFYATYRDILKAQEIGKLVKGTPDLLQEKAALMVAGHLGSYAAVNGTDTPWAMFLEGALATGKSTYSLGTGLKVHQVNNPGSKIIFASNNTLQIENIKKLEEDFGLEAYHGDADFDLINLVETLEQSARDLEKEGGKDQLVEVDTIVFDEATFIDVDGRYTARDTGHAGNYTRIKEALNTINSRRDGAKLKIVFLGDGTQNGFNGGVRLGELYKGDQKHIDESETYNFKPLNIGNKNLIGSLGTDSILVSRPLTAQYRSISAEIPETVNDIKNISIGIDSKELARELKFKTKFGFSTKDKKFLGVNVKSDISEVADDPEYMGYLEQRIRDPKTGADFSIGFASSMFSINSDTATNISNLDETSFLYKLIENYPDSFTLGSHEEMQSLSLDFMMVDMDLKAFPNETNSIQKGLLRNKLKTSVGRGVEHVVIFTHGRWPNISVGKADNSVATHNRETIESVTKETREFTLDKIGDTITTPEPNKSASEENESVASMNPFGTSSSTVTIKKPATSPTEEPKEEIKKDPDLKPNEEDPKPEEPIEPTPKDPKPNKPDHKDPEDPEHTGNESPKPKEQEGDWRLGKDMDVLTLKNNGFVVRKKIGGIYEYMHSKKVPVKAINKETKEDVEIFVSFPVVDEQADAINTGEYSPLATAATVSVVSKLSSEVFTAPIEITSVGSLLDNLDIILEDSNYELKGDNIEGIDNSEIQKVNLKLKEAGSTERVGKEIYHDDRQTGFNSKQEATRALEDLSDISQLKNSRFNSEKEGGASLNKLTSERLYDSTLAYLVPKSKKTPFQVEANEINFKYKLDASNVGSEKEAADLKEEKNYRIEQVYNAQVRERVASPDKYVHKIVLVQDTLKNKTVKDARAHIVSYEKTASGKLINPVIIGNFIPSGDYKIVEALKGPLANFVKGIKEGDPSIITKEVKYSGNVISTSYKEFDYDYTIDTNFTAPGSVIDLNADPSSSEYQEALLIIKHNPYYEEILAYQETLNAAKTKEEVAELEANKPSGLEALIADLRYKGIHVYQEQFVNVNPYNRASAGTTIMFNQSVPANTEPTPARDVINVSSNLFHDKVTEGTTGLRRGHGMINLEAKGITFSQMLTAKINLIKGLTEKETLLAENGGDTSGTGTSDLSSGKVVEMVQVFATIASAMGEVDPSLKIVGKEVFKNISAIREDITKQASKQDGKTISNKTEVVTKDEYKAMVAELKKLPAHEFKPMASMIIGMFNSANIGVIKRHPTTNEPIINTLKADKLTNNPNKETEIQKELAKQGGKRYLAVDSNLIAPIQYVIPIDPELQHGYSSFSINKMIYYLKNYEFTTNKGEKVSMDNVDIGMVLDGILKNTKFSHGIYVNLDKEEGNRKEQAYFAIASPNKIPSLGGNSNLFNTSVVGLTNPNLGLSISNISDALNGVAPAPKKSTEEKDIEVKTYIEQDKEIVDLFTNQKLEEFFAQNEENFEPLFDNLRDPEVDEDSSTYTLSVEAIMKAAEPLIVEFKEALSNPSIRVKKEKAADLEKEILKLIDIKAAEDTSILKSLGINSVESLYDNVGDLLTNQDLESYEEFISFLEVLTQGRHLIMNKELLDIAMAASFSNTAHLYGPELKKEVDSLIKFRYEEIVKEFESRNTIGFKELLDVPIEVGSLESFAKNPTSSDSYQVLLYKAAANNSNALNLALTEKQRASAIENYNKAINLLEAMAPEPTLNIAEHKAVNWANAITDTTVLDAANNLKIEEADGDPVLLAEYKKTYLDRSAEITAMNGFEVTRDKEGDILEQAQSIQDAGNASGIVSYIVSLPKHINSFLSFTVGDIQVGQEELIKTLETLADPKKGDEAAFEKAIEDYELALEERIQYIKSINIMGSKKLGDVVADAEKALELLKTRIFTLEKGNIKLDDLFAYPGSAETSTKPEHWQAGVDAIKGVIFGKENLTIIFKKLATIGTVAGNPTKKRKRKSYTKELYKGVSRDDINSIESIIFEMGKKCKN